MRTMIRAALPAIAMAAAVLAQPAPPEAITTTWLPQATINKNYSVTLSATPGPSPVWSLVQGGLPDGLMLSAGGVISGVPTTLGKTEFLVRASDPTYGVAYEALELDVVLGPLAFTSYTAPIATQNVPYSAAIQVTGGVPPYRFAFASTVTAGLALDPSTGILSGTPPNSGEFAIAITLSDSIGDSLTKIVNLIIAAPLTVLTSSLSNGAPGVAYSQTLTAGGGQAPFSWSANGLPAGLQINAGTGQISGTPVANSTSLVNVEVTDYGHRIASRTLVLTIGPGVIVTQTLLAMGSLGKPYSETLTASGGQPPYTWSVSLGGSLPPGLSLNPATGVISGTPQYASSLTFSVKATDALGETGFGTYTINILAPLRIDGGMLPPGAPGAKYSHILSATGGKPPYRWLAANLPAGLALDPVTGALSGIIAAAGSTTFAVTVNDSSGQSATEAMLLQADASPIPAMTIGGLPSQPGFLQQPAITVSLASSYTADLNGTLTLSFVSSAGGGDAMIQFGTGGMSAAFTIPAGSTQAQFSGKSSVSVLTGTVAGTITLTVSSVTAGGTDVTPTPTPTATITTHATVPFISSINFMQTAGGVTVVVNGFSSALNMTSGTFVFAPATNATLAASSFTVPLSMPFTTWYQSSAAAQYGSEFTLTVPFGVQGSAADLVAVTVTLTNAQGSSSQCSGPVGTTSTCSSSSQ
ncbi:MAG TPA: Ig domain-containing protein [Bryobacteraceae bacterium]|nr:Ig domain-containing protein [Bryobacteraceae bacterium]